jgi:hypothetical protein
MAKQRRRSGAEIAALVAGYEGSGLTRRAYCKQRGIALTTLDYYRRRGKAEPGWVAVELEGEAAACPLTVVLGNGRRIEVSGDFAEAALARLVRVVEEA